MHQAKRPETRKREMLRSLSGRNQLTGRIVELKIDGLWHRSSFPSVGRSLLDHYRRSGTGNAAAGGRNSRRTDQVNRSYGAACLNEAGFWLWSSDCFSCKAQEPGALKVAAAADLQPVLPAIIEEFEQQTHERVEASYASSATLATQILNGGRSDCSFPRTCPSPRK